MNGPRTPQEGLRGSNGCTEVPESTEGESGAWIALYLDYSGITLFRTEIEALRYAVKHSMEVRHVPWGEEIR